MECFLQGFVRSAVSAGYTIILQAARRLADAFPMKLWFWHILQNANLWCMPRIWDTSAKTTISQVAMARLYLSISESAREIVRQRAQFAWEYCGN
jgi:hypothetical protein